MAVGGMHGKGRLHGGGGHAWQGGMHGRGHACQERRPLQRTVRIILECILVLGYFLVVVRSFSLSLPFPFIVIRLLPV